MTKLVFQCCSSDWALDSQTCVRAKQNSYRSVRILLILASCHEKCSELDCPGRNTGSASSSESKIWTGDDGSGTVEGEQASSLLYWKEWPITFAFKYEWIHSPCLSYWPYGLPGKSSRCSSLAVFCFVTQILFVFFLPCLQWAVIVFSSSVSGYCPEFLNVYLQIRWGLHKMLLRFRIWCMCVYRW